MSEKMNEAVAHAAAINAAVQHTVIREAQANLRAADQTYMSDMAAHRAAHAAVSDK